MTDLTRFASALLDGKLLPEALVKEMFTAPTAPTPPRFTFGWTINRPTQAGPAFDYNGSMEGTTAFLYLIPARRYGVALLANRERSVPAVAPIITEVTRLMWSADRLVPHATDVHDHVDRLFHVLNRRPFEPRVEVVLAGEGNGH